jgi:hypothetical protein
MALQTGRVVLATMLRDDSAGRLAMSRHTLFALVAAVLVTPLGISSVEARPHGDRRHGRDGGHAVPRGYVFQRRPPVVITPVRPVVIRPYRPAPRPGLSFGFYYGPSWAGRHSAYGPYAYGYAYEPRPYTYFDDYGRRGYDTPRRFGSVRLDVAQKHAEILVDGYYAGIVDDFDGRFQHLDLSPGVHHIEVRADGYMPMLFNVDIVPDRTLSYRASLHRWDD